jgi:hypothetical protein
VEIDIASPSEFEDLVVEMNIGDQFRLIFSQEPGEAEISVSIFNLKASEYDSEEAEYRPKDERRMILVRELLELLDQGVKAMPPFPRRDPPDLHGRPTITVTVH